MTTKKTSLNAGARQILEDLNEFVNDKPKNVVKLQNFIITRPFIGTKFSSRVANKLFHIPLFVFKRATMNYLLYRVNTDTKQNDKLLVLSEKIDQSIERQEDQIATIAQLFDTKMFDIMKLNDMIKREIMAEINPGKPRMGEEENTKTKWLKKDNIHLKKLNLGSGSHLKDGYINVDHRPIEGIDLVCDISNLPFENNSIEEIFSAHVVEHFTENQVMKMIKKWLDLLEPGGRLVTIVPDIDNMAKEYAKGNIPWVNFRRVILGDQDYSSDYHFNAFSEKYLSNLLKSISKNVKVEVKASGRRNGDALELEVHAVKLR